jgi:hypothetical protein
MTRPISGEIPLGPDFDIADFPMEDAEINVELAHDKTIVVHNARIVAAHRADGKIVLLFEGVTDDEQAVLDLL